MQLVSVNTEATQNLAKASWLIGEAGWANTTGEIVITNAPRPMDRIAGRFRAITGIEIGLAATM